MLFIYLIFFIENLNEFTDNKMDNYFDLKFNESSVKSLHIELLNLNKRH